MFFSSGGVITTMRGTGTSMVSCRGLDSRRVRRVTSGIRITYRGVGQSTDIRRVRSVMRGRLVGRRTFAITHGCVACHCGETLIHGSGSASRRVLSLLRYGGRRMGRRGSGGGPAMGDMRESCVTKRIDGSVAGEFLLPRSVIRTRRGKLVRFRSTSCFTRRVRGYYLIGLRSVLRGNAMVDRAKVSHPEDFSATYGVTARTVTRVTDSRCKKRDVSLSRLTPFMRIDHRGFQVRIQARFRGVKLSLSRRGVGGMTRVHMERRVGHNIRVVRCRIVALVAAGNRTPFVAIFVCLSRIPRKRAESSLTTVVRRVLRREVGKMGGRGKMFVAPTFPGLVCMLRRSGVRRSSGCFCLAHLTTRYATGHVIPSCVSRGGVGRLGISGGKRKRYCPYVKYHDFLAPCVSPRAKGPGCCKHFGRKIIAVGLISITYSSKGSRGGF